MVVDGAASQWNPIISGVRATVSVLSPLLLNIQTSEMLELVENRLIANGDESKLLAVVRKPADRPAVPVPLNRDLDRI